MLSSSRFIYTYSQNVTRFSHVCCRAFSSVHQFVMILRSFTYSTGELLRALEVYNTSVIQNANAYFKSHLNMIYRHYIKSLLCTSPALSIHIQYHVITTIIVLCGRGETFIILCVIYWMRQLSEYCCNDI